MAKVDEKWFEDRGWSVVKREEVREASKMKRITCRKTTKEAFSWWEHQIEIFYDKRGKIEGRSNFYSFYAKGKDFTVKNGISHRKYDEEQIINSLKVVGLE